MIEEILECLGFYRSARSLRLWRISLQVEYQHADEMRWIRKYDAREQLQVAILQRIRRLERDQQELMATGKIPTTPLPRAAGGDRSDVSKYSGILEKELSMARYIWYINKKELAELVLNQPRYGQGLRLREWRKIREVKELQDKSMLWMDGRERCARTDGCCGRTCRCCEEPLMTYFKPTMDTFELRDVEGFHGHCTSECRCCIRHQRVYSPDEGIEKLRRDLLSSDAVENDVRENEDSSSEETFSE
ncbi:hypothetical protein DTO164E3_7489 [Paecilomyces variotii]|nr:hypothetical protein DTO164E3_7489 [Paecilomyces variotii]KAJ9201528.1 hypothetical protein DTO032I3_4155 [Paecilomyces variotii]KAJ9275682.1 hypothetical protein DTO021D3_7502 [Paecilomyces variotii]KAJ9339964.1 hypothetical protein DTO027B6_7535 [Paecilomyces variotii]KAJ9377295.1 hypothetical protein DTO032I4_8212 [Paecilomyces variotii]